MVVSATFRYDDASVVTFEGEALTPTKLTGTCALRGSLHLLGARADKQQANEQCPRHNFFNSSPLLLF